MPASVRSVDSLGSVPARRHKCMRHLSLTSCLPTFGTGGETRQYIARPKAFAHQLSRPPRSLAWRQIGSSPSHSLIRQCPHKRLPSRANRLARCLAGPNSVKLEVHLCGHLLAADQLAHGLLSPYRHKVYPRPKLGGFLTSDCL